jgi:benzodiazapine receptor
MTTYIPSLTLPAALFNSPAVAILSPIAAGTAIGFSMQRT